MISAYIDRIEEGKAVLLLGDDLVKVNLPQQFLPLTVHEGDYVKIEILPDEETTEAAEDEAISLLE